MSLLDRARGEVLVLGESLVDVVTTADGRTEVHPGGSAANVAVALARLGRTVRFASSWGRDENGELVAGHLAREGVVMASDPLVLERTSVAQATLDADGSARYRFDLDWRLGEVEIGRPRVVHFGSIGAVLEPGASQVLDVLDALPVDVLVSFDVNARPAITGTGPDLLAAVERAAARATWVKASDEDLEAIYPGVPIQDAARRLLACGARAVAVTRGAQGCVWVTESQTVEEPSVSVEVIDTIGAGDTFAAALIDALGNGWWEAAGRDQRRALAYAARCAAVTVSRPGADPPRREELT